MVHSEIVSFWDRHCETMSDVFNGLPGADNALIGLLYILIFAHVCFGFPISRLAGVRHIEDWKYSKVSYPMLYMLTIFIGGLLIVLIGIPYIIWRYPNISL